MTAVPSTGRRRQQSLVLAKESFMLAVKEGIESLMQRFGYSRERATMTLLRQLAQGENAPTDDEVFHIMKLQGIGLEAAAQVLIVSKALKRTMKERGVTAVEAIDDLTSRIGFVNLLDIHADKFNDQEDATSQAQRPQTPTTINRLNSPLAVISSVEKNWNLPLTSRKQVAKKPTKSKVDTSKVKPTTAVKASRKRSTLGNEPENSTQVETMGRSRADSVTEVVKAKMAAVDTGATETGIPGPVARGKRRVLDDPLSTATTQAPGKRQRSGEK